MRRIDLTNYTVRVRNPEGEYTELPYEMKDSMTEVLLARDLQLAGSELLVHNDIARKIKDSEDDYVLLEEAEYSKLVLAVNTVKGLGRPDVEFVRRILKAEKIEVEAKK